MMASEGGKLEVSRHLISGSGWAPPGCGAAAAANSPIPDLMSWRRCIRLSSLSRRKWLDANFGSLHRRRPYASLRADAGEIRNGRDLSSPGWGVLGFDDD